MYLVRTIQKKETSQWVANLGKHSRYHVPLPVVPRLLFSGLIVIHQGAAREFDVDRVDYPSPPVNVPVGSKGAVVVRAKTRIFVKRGPKRIGRALVRGFQGIRYAASWSAVAQTIVSPASSAARRPFKALNAKVGRGRPPAR